MKILIKQATVADKNSTHNLSVKDILVDNGFVKQIADNIDADAEIFNADKSCISPGWVDVFAHACDPGYEHKETLETLAEAAAAGGYTQVFVLPNTNPIIQGKAQVEYIVQKSKSLPLHIHPLGALSKNTEGKELAEMYDMRSSGAIAFTDGTQPVQTAGLLLKALQYVKAFDGVIIQIPMDKSIGANGLMNEGIVSTRLGLPGTPAMAEEIMVARDIKLARYTESKLHFTGVSSAKSMEYIMRAKDGGIQVSCSVAPYHLFFCDEDLESYDTNLKVSPPLRSRNDMMGLRDAVAKGYVDCIASHHLPQDWDSKTCEFEYAKNGMIGLQTAYAVLQTVLPSLQADNIASLFSGNARKIFGLNEIKIEEGSEASFTVFNPNGKTVLSAESNKSKSSNSPFMNKELNGRVEAIVSKNKLIINR